MDAFFAAVEQLDNPALRGMPVIVGGDPAGRGVVSTASYEARAFGVRSAMPASRAASLCPGAIWVKPRFGRYAELSEAVRRILEAETPYLEPASIDEAYADITPGRTGSHPVVVARRIQTAVERLGVTCSIGLATSKTVAKIASDHVKPRGLTIVAPGTESAFLAQLPVRALPGIGAVSAERLERAGVTTLGVLGALDQLTAGELLGSHGSTMVARATGVDDRPVAVRQGAKSVSNERTFAVDVREAAEIRSAIIALARKVSARLRRKTSAGRTVTLKVRYSDFTTRTAQRTLPVATADADEIVATALDLLSGVWSPGVGIRLLGVAVSGFETPSTQLDLLGEVVHHESRERERLARSIESVKERFGEDAIRSGRTIGGRPTP